MTFLGTIVVYSHGGPAIYGGIGTAVQFKEEGVKP